MHDDRLGLQRDLHLRSIRAAYIRNRSNHGVDTRLGRRRGRNGQLTGPGGGWLRRAVIWLRLPLYGPRPVRGRRWWWAARRRGGGGGGWGTRLRHLCDQIASFVGLLQITRRVANMFGDLSGLVHSSQVLENDGNLILVTGITRHK